MKKLPIGYWIKKADEHFTNGINEIQAAYKITRTEWQILNYISEGNSVGKEELVAIMHPFADMNAVGKIVSKLVSAGLIRVDAHSMISLTKDGKDLHTACLNKQQEFREKIMNGISNEEYEATIATLQKMISNITKTQSN